MSVTGSWFTEPPMKDSPEGNTLASVTSTSPVASRAVRPPNRTAKKQIARFLFNGRNRPVSKATTTMEP